jgi:prolyl-tRNA synthetase
MQFMDENGDRQHVWQTSWAVSTRFVGGIIMTHGDDAGLMLPPRIAPIQVKFIGICISLADSEALVSHQVDIRFNKLTSPNHEIGHIFVLYVLVILSY